MLGATVHPCWSLTRVFGANRLNRAVDTALQEAVEGAQSPGLGSSSLKPRAWLVPAPVREKTDRRAEVNTAGSPRGGRDALPSGPQLRVLTPPLRPQGHVTEMTLLGHRGTWEGLGVSLSPICGRHQYLSLPSHLLPGVFSPGELTHVTCTAPLQRGLHRGSTCPCSVCSSPGVATAQAACSCLTS